jgi:proliferating cell nuclear antigen
MAEYEMKLMDIDTDQLGIPETEYDAKVRLSAAEFARICRDLSQLGESVRIEVSKEGIRFTSEGEAANGNVLLKQTSGAPKIKNEGSSSKKVKKSSDDEDDDEEKVKEEEDADKMEEDNTPSGTDKALFKPPTDDEAEMISSADEEEAGSKKRKKTVKKEKSTKKAKKDKADDEDDFVGVQIEMTQHVNLTFSLKYLVNFAKSASLCRTVTLMMSSEVPLLVRSLLLRFPALLTHADRPLALQVMYKFEQGYIQYYLAPKIGDE